MIALIISGKKNTEARKIWLQEEKTISAIKC